MSFAVVSFLLVAFDGENDFWNTCSTTSRLILENPAVLFGAGWMKRRPARELSFYHVYSVRLV